MQIRCKDVLDRKQEPALYRTSNGIVSCNHYQKYAHLSFHSTALLLFHNYKVQCQPNGYTYCKYKWRVNHFYYNRLYTVLKRLSGMNFFCKSSIFIEIQNLMISKKHWVSIGKWQILFCKRLTFNFTFLLI